MRPTRPTMTYVGIAVAAAGFVAIIFTWGKVAALTAVPLQLPYLVSGGLTGLGLIMIGVTLINVQAKRQDAAVRDRQMDQLSEVLAEIRVLLGGEERPVADVEAPADAETHEGDATWEGAARPAASDEVTDQIPLQSAGSRA
jgi:hypothetical protein